MEHIEKFTKIAESNLESKLDKIFLEGKKYNMIDRFFFYQIEEKALKADIYELDLNEDDKQEIQSELFYVFRLQSNCSFIEEIGRAHV